MASTVSLIQMLAAGCVDSTGTPIASGKARFYQPGTLTPVTAYSDAAGTTAITPPLTLTAGGTGVAYTQAPTRLILKDSADTSTLFDGNVNTARADAEYVTTTGFNGGVETTLKTILDAWPTAFGGSAGLWKYKAYSDATERNPKDVITEIQLSVKSYGAVGNGVADDTAAIQATITKVASLGGGIVYVPPGTYFLSAALTITSNNVHIVGAGPGASTLKQSNASAGVLAFTTTAVGIIHNRVTGLKFDHSTTTTAAAISGQCLAVDNVYISELHFTYGVDATGGSVWYLTNSVIGGLQDAGGTSVPVRISGASGVVVAGVTASRQGNGRGAVEVSTTGNFIAQSTIDGSLNVNAGSNGIKVLSGGGAVIVGNKISAASGNHAISIDAAAGEVQIGAQQTLSPDVLDSRTGAPIAYSFGTNSSVTPLPLQTDTVRITATAAITVTVNAAAVVEHGRLLTIECLNNSGGAVTWTFNAQYKTSGAVAPATGNGISVIFKYDAISAAYREVARSAAVAI